jgi:hypothetical protein
MAPRGRLPALDPLRDTSRGIARPPQPLPGRDGSQEVGGRMRSTATCQCALGRDHRPGIHRFAIARPGRHPRPRSEGRNRRAEPVDGASRPPAAGRRPTPQRDRLRDRRSLHARASRTHVLLSLACKGRTLCYSALSGKGRCAIMNKSSLFCCSPIRFRTRPRRT